MMKRTSELKKKTFKHKGLFHRFAKGETNAFLKNVLIVNGITAAGDEPDPFKFIITIVRIDTITIKSINVQGEIATEDNFIVEDDKITCEINAFVGGFTFQLIIMAEGEPGSETTFTLTCDGDEVFKKDQKISITSGKKGGFSNASVPLP